MFEENMWLSFLCIIENYLFFFVFRSLKSRISYLIIFKSIEISNNLFLICFAIGTNVLTSDCYKGYLILNPNSWIITIIINFINLLYKKKCDSVKVLFGELLFCAELY